MNVYLDLTNVCVYYAEYSVSLPWLTRMKIAVDTAKGLAFLHCEEPPIIYRDFKASNILLDSVYSSVSFIFSYSFILTLKY